MSERWMNERAITQRQLSKVSKFETALFDKLEAGGLL